MISEIDLLIEDIPALEKRFGAHNPFVEVLKAQLASLQNPAELKRQEGSFYAGVLNYLRSLIAKIEDFK
jgi:hypothetical protein